MSVIQPTIASPVEVVLKPESPSKFDRERSAFHGLLPTLLQSHRGQYVAIHNGEAVDSGPNRLDVAMRVLQRLGNVDIYVGLVSDQPEPVYRSGVRRDLTRIDGQK
jgi:hypothetical protein